MVTKRRGKSQSAVDLARDIVAYENNEPAKPRKKCNDCFGDGVRGRPWADKILAQTWGSQEYKEEFVKKAIGKPCSCTERGGRNRTHGPAMVELAKHFLKGK